MTHLHLLAVPSALFRPHSIARHLFDQIAQPPPVPTRKTLLRLFIAVSSLPHLKPSAPPWTEVLLLCTLHRTGGGSTSGTTEAFELAAKFCYGVNFEITTTNVAQLRCVSEYLEMTDQYAVESLASRLETFIDGVVCKSLEMSVEVLHQCENLLPLSEDLKIVGRCIDAIVSKACAEQIASSFSRLEYSSSGRLHMSKQAKNSGDWWIEDLSILRVDFYQRVIEAMKCRGVRPESIGASLVHFAEKYFKKEPNIWNILIDPKVEPVSNSFACEGRLVIESIVSLLPAEKHAVQIGFLFGLLRSAMMFDCTMSCRLTLERRVGSQLEMATLDDLLIPSFQHAGDTLFDVDTVHRILSSLVKVANLVDNYLAEIAPDANLKLANFIAIVDTLPGFARATDDGLYRAVDIYLKAHQELSDSERRRLCKVIDFQKLSLDASGHAAQNERLPLQATVQVLYMEQLRLRNALGFSTFDADTKTSHPSRRTAHGSPTSPRDAYASLRRENRELKVELGRMRARLSDLERGRAGVRDGDLDKPSSAKAVISMSRKIGRKLHLFGSSKSSQGLESGVIAGKT
ncbi:hypothetical protein HPP92_024334 [Vanilla planifolia]|uniref:NPH3 domain-containing protein n=1 Tax=Vanilla planifolia TaxID=51239 RepID=A0A835PM75_VANPL|nr:hypothetical protein HPP92_024334 [Vanilla planifolia]